MDETINSLQQDLRIAYVAFVDVAERLDPSKRATSGVCGVWSPKEVLDHLIGWDASLKHLIMTPQTFVPPEDVHQFNDQSLAERDNQTWAESLHEIKANFQALNEALETVEAEMRVYPHVIRWLPGRVADYELHTGQLAAWL